MEFISTTDQQCLNATIQHIQVSSIPIFIMYYTIIFMNLIFISINVFVFFKVDNQLATCVNPVLAYPSPDPAGSHDSSYPVIKLCVEKVPHKSPFTVVFKVCDCVCLYVATSMSTLMISNPFYHVACRQRM